MIFQDDLLFPHLDVAANIRFGLKGQSRKCAADRLAEVATLCGVESLLRRRPDSLSGGERQRVGLARALAPRPRLLLCDEPVSALDLENRFAVIERLGAVQRALAIPMLCVTHNPAEAIALGTRLFLLSAGTIVDQGAPLEVLARQPACRGGRGGAPLSELRNIFSARVEGPSADGGATVLRLDDGPIVMVALQDGPAGTRVSVSVRAEDIVLARGPIAGLSARNLVAGTVDRVHHHGPEAEVIVRTGGIVWIASVVTPAVAALELGPGAPVHMIIKARSCQVRATGD
jgi:molybdate transport system ATP-binding protein